jgi:hypothetical protein
MGNCSASVRDSVDETVDVLLGGDAEAATKVAVEMTLVDKAGGGRDIENTGAAFQQAACVLNALRELVTMWRQAGARTEQSGEAEFADTGGQGEFVERDVRGQVVAEVGTCSPKRGVVARGAASRH